jgi:hypothetical protein
MYRIKNLGQAKTTSSRENDGSLTACITEIQKETFTKSAVVKNKKNRNNKVTPLMNESWITVHEMAKPGNSRSFVLLWILKSTN